MLIVIAVGYQKTDYATGGFTLGVHTFDAIGKTIKLADLKVVGGDAADNFLQFLRPNCSTKKYTFTKEQKDILDEYYQDAYGETLPDTVSQMLCYIGEEEAEEIGDTEPGWYFTEDYDFILPVTNLSEFDIKYGSGFFFQPVTSKAQLQYAGEVVRGNTEFSFDVGGFSMTGNASPVDRDLGYFKVNGGDAADNFLQFLKPNASTQKYTFTKEQKAILDEYYQDAYGETLPETVSQMLCYIGEEEAEEIGDTDPGWYFTEDYDFILPVSTLFTVKAGEGFMFQPVTSAVKLQIPGAID